MPYVAVLLCNRLIRTVLGKSIYKIQVVKGWGGVIGGSRFESQCGPKNKK